MSGIQWRPDAVVVSEQMLPPASHYEVRIADCVVRAEPAGRDDGTNVAVLRLETKLSSALPAAAPAKLGTLALVLGTGQDGMTARLATIRSVGGTWQSLAGGTIDHRIVLDTRIGAGEEGAPVLGPDGALLGMATRGRGREFLVIPASTIERAVAALLEKGRVERGWLGLALRPVALPEILQPERSQRIGLMAMQVHADGPAAKAGILPGDILLSAGGTPAVRPGSLARQLGAQSIGQTIEIRIARAGSISTQSVTIEARPSS